MANYCPRCHSKDIWTKKNGAFAACSSCGFDNDSDKASPARYRSKRLFP